MSKPTPETDALAENLIFIVEKITEFNAQYVIKQILTEILTKTTKMERGRDEAREAIKSTLEWINARRNAHDFTTMNMVEDRLREALEAAK